MRGREALTSNGILTGENVRAGGVETSGLGCCWYEIPAAMAAVKAFIAVVRLDAGEISPSLRREETRGLEVTIVGRRRGSSSLLSVPLL